MAVPLLRHRFTVDEYHRMAEAGIFTEDDRVELIEGEIVEMTPIGRRHFLSVTTLNHLLVSAVGERALVSVQNPVHLTRDSEPLPDIAVLRRRPDYREVDVGPDDVLLMIEVADTSVDYDRMVKVPLYGKAGIREVWLVDLPGEHLEAYRCPGAQGYGQVQRFGRGQRVTCEALPDLSVAIDEIL